MVNYGDHQDPYEAKAQELQSCFACRELEQLARQRVEEVPGAAQWHDWLGMALFNQGKVDGAAQAYAEAVRLQPTNADYRERLNGAQEFLSSPLKAKANELQAAFRWPELEGLARQRVAAEPDAAIWYSYLGCALANQGDTDGAIQAMGSAVRLQPTNHEYRDELEVYMARVQAENEAAHHEADRLWGAQRLPELEQLARQRVAATSDAKWQAHWYGYLGMALCSQNDFSGAAQVLAKAVGLDPSNELNRAQLKKARELLDPLKSKASQLNNAGCFAELEALARRRIAADCIDLGAGFGSAYWHNKLGVALLFGRGDLAGAASELEEAVRLEPADYNYALQSERVQWVVSSMADDAANDPQKLERHLKMAGLISPAAGRAAAQPAAAKAAAAAKSTAPAASPPPSALKARVRELEAAGRHAELEALAREQLAEEPGVAFWHARLGGALYKRADFSGAAEALAEAVRLEPRNAGYQRNLTQAQAKLKSQAS